MRFRQPRIEDKKHLDFVRSLPCVICADNTRTEAAHIRSGELKYGKEHTGLQQKPHDRWTVPLCGMHHRDQHKQNEFRFWDALRINPFTLAMTLHGISGNHELALTAIELHRGEPMNDDVWIEVVAPNCAVGDSGRFFGMTTISQSSGPYGPSESRVRFNLSGYIRHEIAKASAVSGDHSAADANCNSEVNQ